MPTGAHETFSQRKRHHPFAHDVETRSKADDRHISPDVLDDDDSEHRSCDTEEPPTPPPKRQKRAARYTPGMYLAASSPVAASSTASSKERGEGGKSKLFGPEDFRAAQTLMLMCLDDAALARGSKGSVDSAKEGDDLN